MADTLASPLASGLVLNATQDGTRIVFDFAVGTVIARLQMETAQIPAIVSEMMKLLTADSLQRVPPKGLATGLHASYAPPLVEFGTSAEPLREMITLDLELPAQAQICVHMTFDDAKRLIAALAAAIEKATDRDQTMN